VEISQDLQVRLLDRNQGQTNKEFETSQVRLKVLKKKVYTISVLKKSIQNEVNGGINKF